MFLVLVLVLLFDFLYAVLVMFFVVSIFVN